LEVDRFDPVSPDSAFLDLAEPEDLDAFAPLDFAELAFAAVVFCFEFDFDEADSDFFGEVADLTAAVADLAAGRAAATPAAAATALPAVDRDFAAEDLPRAPDELPRFFAVVFESREPVIEGSDSLTVSTAFDPASLTASAPSATASPTDRSTFPAWRPTPRADRFTAFATAPAASDTGSVTRSSVPLRFLALLMITS